MQRRSLSIISWGFHIDMQPYDMQQNNLENPHTTPIFPVRH